MSNLSGLEIFAQPSLIAFSFTNCLRLFQQLYLTLTQRECLVNGQVPLTKLGNEYGRLGIWGAESGADRSGRGSLDDLLRHESNFKSIVIDLLQDLIDDLERGSSIRLHQYLDLTN